MNVSLCALFRPRSGYATAQR